MDPNQRSHGSGRSYYVALGAHGKSPGLFGHTWLMVLQLTLDEMAHQRGRCAIASTSIELVIPSCSSSVSNSRCKRRPVRFDRIGISS